MNFRFLLISTAASIITVVFLVLSLNISLWFLTVPIMFFVLICTFLMFYIFKKNLYKVLSCAVSVAIMLIITGIVIFTFANHYNQVADAEEYSVSGNILTINKYDDYYKVILEDVNVNGINVKGNLSLSITTESNIITYYMRTGDIIKFNTDVLDYTPLYNGLKTGYNYRNNISYKAYTEESLVDLVFGTMKPIQKLRFGIQSALRDNVPQYSELIYGMITGDKGFVSTDMREYYSITGLSHVLSVSGLHVSLIAAALGFLLKKIIRNKYVNFSVIMGVLVFYCFVASFSAGVVRASLMFLYNSIAEISGKKSDRLSSLGFAATTMLCVRPLFIFDVGFILSFSAVAGIILFNGFFSKVFGFIRPAFLRKSFCVSLSCQIGIMPASIIIFNSFPTYLIFANVLVLPLLQLSFIAEIVSLIIYAMMPFSGILISGTAIPVVIADNITKWIAALPLADIRLFGGALIFLVIVLYFVISRFVFLKKFKPLLSIVCVLLSVGFVAVGNISPVGNACIISTAYYKDVSSLVIESNEVYITGNVSSSYHIKDMMTAAKRRTIKAAYIPHLSEKSANAIVEINKAFPIKAVYCPENADISGLSILAQSGVQFFLFQQNTILDGKFFCVTETDFTAYIYSGGETDVLFVPYGYNLKNAPEVIINKCGVIRSYVYQGIYAERIYFVNYDTFDEEVPQIQTVLDSNSMLAFYPTDGRIKYLYR